MVTLTAVPDSWYHFDHWSGALAGATNPTTITMDTDKDVTANFAINTYTLTTHATHGSITKKPPTGPYPSGTVVTLTAVPDSWYHFDHWSGALAGATNPTTITMDADKDVTANFAINTPSVPVGRGPVPSASTPTLTINKVYVVNYRYRTVSVIDGDEEHKLSWLHPPQVGRYPRKRPGGPGKSPQGA